MNDCYKGFAKLFWPLRQNVMRLMMYKKGDIKNECFSVSLCLTMLVMSTEYCMIEDVQRCNIRNG